jgi:hypothetical protein
MIAEQIHTTAHALGGEKADRSTKPRRVLWTVNKGGEHEYCA